MNRPLKPWEWAECDLQGNQIHIFDGRLQMPIYDKDLDDQEYVKKTTEYWAKISEQYPLTSEELYLIVRRMAG